MPIKKYLNKIFLLTIFCHSIIAETGSIGADFISPVTNYNARIVLILGTVATLGLLAFEDQIIDPTQQETIENKPMGPYSKYFDYGGMGIPNAAYFLYMGTRYIFTGNQYYGSRAGLMFKTSTYSGIVVNALKYTVREPRPGNPKERTSFPSGHSAMAFSFASAVAASHSWYTGIIAYFYAMGVAYSRMNDNRHYIHDVVAGATLGASYGIALAQKMNLKSSTSSFFQLLPTDDIKGMQLAMTFLF